MTGPVFDMPASPEGWGSSPARLMRIIDPLGNAIAWFAPEFGGSCAGYAVRQAVDTASGSQSSWHHVIPGSVSDVSNVVQWNDDRTTQSSWRFVERDPASCTMEWIPEDASEADPWLLTASLANAQLSLFLRIHNSGPEPLQTGVCLQFVMSSAPRISTRGEERTGTSDPESSRFGTSPGQGQSGLALLIVSTEPDQDAVKTEQTPGGIRCAISTHRLNDSSPVIQPGELRRLHVLICPERHANSMAPW